MKNGSILLIIGSGILIVIGIMFIGLTQAADEEYQEQARQKVELKQTSSKTTSGTSTSSATTTKPEESSFYIDDRTTSCSGERELLFADTEFRYYLPCYQSKNIYLVYSSTREITVREAIDTGYITISDLINNGLDVIKEAVQ